MGFLAADLAFRLLIEQPTANNSLLQHSYPGSDLGLDGNRNEPMCLVSRTAYQPDGNTVDCSTRHQTAVEETTPQAFSSLPASEIIQDNVDTLQ